MRFTHSVLDTSTRVVFNVAMFKQALLGTTCFLAGLVSAVGISSHSEGLKIDSSRPFRIDLGYGSCKHTERDGVFWQEENPHSNNFTPKCGELGISGDLNPAYGWALRRVWLGYVKTRALADTFPKDDRAEFIASEVQRAECATVLAGNCKYQWNGDGMIDGFSAVLSFRLYQNGRFRIDPEAGAFVYHMDWRQQLYPMGKSDGPSRFLEINQKSGWFVSPQIGVTTRYGLLYAGYRLFFRTSEHTPMTAPYKGPVHQLVAGVSW